MYGIQVTNVLDRKGHLVLGGDKVGNGDYRPGITISDGDRMFEVIGVPFVRYRTTEAMQKGIMLEIKRGDFDGKELEGKLLTVVH